MILIFNLFVTFRLCIFSVFPPCLFFTYNCSNTYSYVFYRYLVLYSPVLYVNVTVSGV